MAFSEIVIRYVSDTRMFAWLWLLKMELILPHINFTKLLRGFGWSHLLTTARTPQFNGPSENFARSLKSITNSVNSQSFQSTPLDYHIDNIVTMPASKEKRCVCVLAMHILANLEIISRYGEVAVWHFLVNQRVSVFGKMDIVLGSTQGNEEKISSTNKPLKRRWY